jgi:hypothetical protein
VESQGPLCQWLSISVVTDVIGVTLLTTSSSVSRITAAAAA